MRRFAQISGINGRICGAILGSALAIFAPTAGAAQSSQDQAPPLGTAAKEARAEKPPVAPGKKIWTNDNLPTNPFAISIVGPPAPPPAPEEKPVTDKTKTDEKTGSAKELPKSQPELEAFLAKEIEALALAEKQYDLSKRDFALQQQAFYANAKANQDEAGQAQLAEVQKQLDAMLADLEARRARVAELQLKVDAGQKKATPAPSEAGTTHETT